MSQSLAATLSVSNKEKQFYDEVIQGLTAQTKTLSSKYFYDKTGDKLFQKIMGCPEYYLSRCELEILKGQSAQIAEVMKAHGSSFDVISLGVGDGSKSEYLIKELLKKGLINNYFPVDISAHIITYLETHLSETFPELNVKGYNGEYLDMLKQISKDSSKPKAVIFLGSNIGNFKQQQAIGFCRQLHQHLQPNDLLYIGFDLKKHPKTILKAYNDRQGYTKQFNLNLLTRINRELNANFDVTCFDHYPTYDPLTGTCKSFLVSLKAQKVQIGQQQISFEKEEPILMEVSQKYSIEEIKFLAEESDFKVLDYFFDTKKWFTDALWRSV